MHFLDYSFNPHTIAITVLISQMRRRPKLGGINLPDVTKLWSG